MTNASLWKTLDGLTRAVEADDYDTAEDHAMDALAKIRKRKGEVSQ